MDQNLAPHINLFHKDSFQQINFRNNFINFDIPINTISASFGNYLDEISLFLIFIGFSEITSTLLLNETCEELSSFDLSAFLTSY